MKTELKVDNPEERTPKFPMLLKSIDVLVLMHKPRCGVVLESYEEYWSVGDYCTDWVDLCDGHWTVLGADTSVTLTNTWSD